MKHHFFDHALRISQNPLTSLLIVMAGISMTSVLTTGISDGQTTVGSSTGWVVADAGSDSSNIQPGENSTISLASLAVPNTQTSPNSAVFAQSNFPDVKLKVDSRNAPGKVAYGGAYFGDRLNFTGGVGAFEIGLRWGFDGGISGARGAYGIGALPPDAPLAGSAAVDFKVFLSPFGDSVLNISDTDLFKDLALAPSLVFGEEILDVPSFDPFDTSGGSYGPSGGNFLFEEYDEQGMATGNLVGGYYTDENADDLIGTGGGARIDWNYGDSFDIGVLLEGWAANGGVVDFSQTGSFVSITVPQGTTVTSSSGATYNVIFAVPEPSFASLLFLGSLSVVLRRRRQRGL
jgi:hypothetical protein